MAAEINTDLCTGCGRCVESCPSGAIALDESIRKAVIDPSLCTECGVCIDKCRKGAISITPAMNPEDAPFMGDKSSFQGRVQSGRGQGRGRGMGSGSGMGCGCGSPSRPDFIGECYCPGCGISMPHKAGIPCSDTKCPACGGSMIRKKESM